MVNPLSLKRFETTTGAAATIETVQNYKSAFQSNTYENEDEKALRNTTSAAEGDKNFVAQYYAVTTDLYEYGWGDGFHFAMLRQDETFNESMRRYEYYLALRMGLKPGNHVVDLGCGIAGPARNIARFVGCHVTGVNITEYQVNRAREINKKMGLEDICNVVCSDFMKTPFENESFDGAYEIEATCHTLDKVSCYKEAFRVLKPGACFAGYEWVMTDNYDPENPRHNEIRYGIELGNGLPELPKYHVVIEALEEAGFIVEQHFDASKLCQGKTWYSPLESRFTFKDFLRTRAGHIMTQYMTAFLEKWGLLPKGMSSVNHLLMGAAENLVEGGKLDIFTPSYFFLARKPLKN